MTGHCPTCQAWPGQPCARVTLLGRRRELPFPHLERDEA